MHPHQPQADQAFFRLLVRALLHSILPSSSFFSSSSSSSSTTTTTFSSPRTSFRFISDAHKLIPYSLTCAHLTGGRSYGTDESDHLTLVLTLMKALLSKDAVDFSRDAGAAAAAGWTGTAVLENLAAVGPRVQVHLDAVPIAAAYFAVVHDVLVSHPERCVRSKSIPCFIYGFFLLFPVFFLFLRICFHHSCPNPKSLSISRNTSAPTLTPPPPPTHGHTRPASSPVPPPCKTWCPPP